MHQKFARDIINMKICEGRNKAAKVFTYCEKPKVFIIYLFIYFYQITADDMFLDPLSGIHLLSGMSLLSRYKPESCPALPCPALFCLIKSAALVEHMTDSCLVQLEQMTSPTAGISFCLYPLPFFWDSVPLFASVALLGLARPPSLPAFCEAQCSC